MAVENIENTLLLIWYFRKQYGIDHYSTLYEIMLLKIILLPKMYMLFSSLFTQLSIVHGKSKYIPAINCCHRDKRMPKIEMLKSNFIRG